MSVDSFADNLLGLAREYQGRVKGIRKKCAEAPAAYYETDKLMSEYAEFHYGDTYFDVPNFPQTLAKLGIQAMGDRPHRRALDLGCATGRATFELARHFDHLLLVQGCRLPMLQGLRHVCGRHGVGR